MSPGLDRLHPVVVHHIVNSLGWQSLRALQEQAVGPVLDGARRAAPRAHGGRQDRSGRLPAADRDGTAALVRPFGHLRLPAEGAAEQPAAPAGAYASWLGRRVAVWHGDVTASARQRILREPPDVLLTTPESLEAMLISLRVEHGRMFSDLRAIVVDEVHAFAGDDRGWHLLAVLERLTRVTGRPIQRIGLSATVGNPGELLGWLQGTGRGQRPAVVVAPEHQPSSRPERTPSAAGNAEEKSLPAAADIELDYVGSVSNAATVIATLHRGEKRLVFCDSRQLVEEIGAALRERGVTTYLSHASLSIDERRRAEQAFAEGAGLRHRRHLHPGARDRRR